MRGVSCEEVYCDDMHCEGVYCVRRRTCTVNTCIVRTQATLGKPLPVYKYIVYYKSVISTGSGYLSLAYVQLCLHIYTKMLLLVPPSQFLPLWHSGDCMTEEKHLSSLLI